MGAPEQRATAFLVDSQLPRALAKALAGRGHDALHVADWRGGAHRNARDPDLLALAAREGRAIITYDLTTFPNDAYDLLAAGKPFAGVLVVTRAIGQTDIGRQVAAVAAVIAEYDGFENAVIYLQPTDAR
jgi:predicted nuclease of predicted toxin-antitoxin system